MKRYLLSGLAIVCMVLSLAGAGWKDGGKEEDRGKGRRRTEENGGQQRQARVARPSVVIKMRRYDVPRPNIIQHPGHIVNDQRRISWPQRDERGAVITQRAAALPPRYHAAVVRNTAFVRGIEDRERVERVPGRYYWHVDHGMRYAHFYDHGIHWYGFYHGPTFYWTRLYANRWWWFDLRFNRWVYWWDGFWWWPSPAGPVYVYVDNSYYPYEGGTVVVQNPEMQPPPQSVPGATEGASWNSPDGTRMVQVYGSRSEAFLYDKSGPQPAFMKYIAEGVEKARFSGGKNGRPLNILIDFKDGSFAMFDANGNPIDAASSAPAPTDLPSAGAPPEDMPTEPPPGATPPPGQPAQQGY